MICGLENYSLECYVGTLYVGRKGACLHCVWGKKLIS